MNNEINDDRHLNAIGRATRGEEPECDKEWREDLETKKILAERIKTRFWRCNELTEKQAKDYAWIAVKVMEKWLEDMNKLWGVKNDL